MCEYSRQNRISNTDLFAKYKIGGIETFLIQVQLRWAGPKIGMSDERIPKILIYSQLHDRKKNAGR